jgi:hypothetical protein
MYCVCYPGKGQAKVAGVVMPQGLGHGLTQTVVAGHGAVQVVPGVLRCLLRRILLGVRRRMGLLERHSERAKGQE